MKKIVRIVLFILLALLFTWPVYYFVAKKSAKKEHFTLTQPTRKNLENFVMCSGVVLPKEEVEIKSRVSGVLEEVYVKTGDKVRKNQIIAKISIIPNMSELAASESQWKQAKIQYDNQKTLYDRDKTLFEKGIISKADFEKTETSYLVAHEQLNNARRGYKIIKSGNYSNKQTSNTSIISTIDGVVTLLPTKIGTSVIESNNFNEGTTIAKVANINEMIFVGNVKEFEVAQLKEGMDVNIDSAIHEQDQLGVLTEVSTSGKNSNGLVLFEIKTTLSDFKTKKTGFSANAKIITKVRNQVLALKEEWLSTEGDSTFVWVQKNKDQLEKRAVTLGLSDGIFTEVIAGLSDNEKIRVYDN